LRYHLLNSTRVRYPGWSRIKQARLFPGHRSPSSIHLLEEVPMSYARHVRSIVAAGAAVIALSQAAYSQHDAYQTIENWFKLPEGRKIGSTPGITPRRDRPSAWTLDRCGGESCAGPTLA